MPSPVEILADGIAHVVSTFKLQSAAGALAPLADKSILKLVRLVTLTLLAIPGLLWSNSWAAYLNHCLIIIFHEAGHGVMFPFWTYGYWGRMSVYMGGSAAQIVVPLMFMAAAWSVRRRYEAGLMFLWLGINFADVAVYASDGKDRALPLIFGMDKDGHDWGNILSATNMLDYAHEVGQAIWMGGPICFVLALVVGFHYADND